MRASIQSSSSSPEIGGLALLFAAAGGAFWQLDSRRARKGKRRAKRGMTGKVNIRVGVIGYGYWGPNLVRNFTTCAATEVRVVADRDPARLEALRLTHPWVETTADPARVLEHPEVDAVCVVTPLATHHQLARRALLAGKHVLVEKPLADSEAACRELDELARARGLTLMVDHTFVFTGAVHKLKEYVSGGVLGKVLYFDSVRINLGLFQPDSNVVWDLAPHDLSILDHVIGGTPRWVSALGARHFGREENLAYLTVGYDDDLLAHVHVNWMSPVKVRRIQIAGDRRMVVYDDIEVTEKIRLYDHGVTVGGLDAEGKHNLLVSYRTGDVLAPKLDGTEALRKVVLEFVRAIDSGTRPLTDAAAGTRVVRLIEAAQRSLREGSARVPV
jgi:predicted dehydrogenase